MAALNPSKISLRDFKVSDIPMVCDYWFRSPEGFIESRGVDFSKMPPEPEFHKNIKEKVEDNQKAGRPDNALIILYDGKPVGMHTMFPLTPGEEGIFHAHIFFEKFRGKGVALISYRLACEEFFKRFNLKKVVFKTPAQNIPAIKVKQKLGVPKIGEEIIDFGIIKAGTKAQVFEWTREEFFS